MARDPTAAPLIPLDRAGRVALAALVLVLVGGTEGYHRIEGWGYLDALYMVVITLTTIGYGEVHPLTPAGRVFTMILIIGGVSLGAYTVTQVTRMVIEGGVMRAWRRRRTLRRMRTVRDHYVVVGFNQLGQAVTDELRSAGAPVCVIDKDETKEVLAAAQGLPFVLGDASSDDILTMAGVKHAKGVAVTMTDLGDAILVTLSVRQLAPKVVIATRVADAAAIPKAKRAGADHIVSPNAMGGWRMAHSLVRPHTMNLLDVATLARSDDLLLDEFELSPSSPFVGRSLADLEVRTRYEASIVALRRASGELLVTPRAEDTLQGGDVIIAIGKPAGVRELVAGSKENNK